MSLPLAFKEVTSACCTLSKVQRERFLSTRHNVAYIEKKFTLHQPTKTKCLPPQLETSISDTYRVVSHAQNDRWGLGPMETSISGANHAVLHAQNDRWGLGLIDTINSGHNVAVVNAQNHRWGLWPIETYNSDVKVAVLKAKTTNEGWDP